MGGILYTNPVLQNGNNKSKIEKSESRRFLATSKAKESETKVIDLDKNLNNYGKIQIADYEDLNSELSPKIINGQQTSNGGKEAIISKNNTTNNFVINANSSYSNIPDKYNVNFNFGILYGT